jgi:hypothetical protein
MTEWQPRWLCKSCDWVGDYAHLLRAPNPFDSEMTLLGCPKCKAPEDVAPACDEPGCDKRVSCGWLSADGYRVTCSEHSRMGAQA